MDIEPLADGKRPREPEVVVTASCTQDNGRTVADDEQ